MTITQMNYFKVIASSGSLSMAAAQLFVSQPTLSIAMKKLENEVGCPLFISSGKGVALTDEGHRLLKQILPLLDQYAEIQKTMLNLDGFKQRLHIGMSSFGADTLYPDLRLKFMEQYPDIHLTSIEASAKELAHMVENRQADAIISVFPKKYLNPEQYKRAPLGTSNIVFCVNRRSPFANREKITLLEISKSELVMKKDEYQQDDRLIKEIEDAGGTPKVIHYTHQVHTVRKFIAKNIAAGFLPISMIENYPEIVGIPFEPHNASVTELIWQKMKPASPPLKNFIRIASDFYSNRIEDGTA